jgi:hypothetical protein
MIPIETRRRTGGGYHHLVRTAGLPSLVNGFCRSQPADGAEGATSRDRNCSRPRDALGQYRSFLRKLGVKTMVADTAGARAGRRARHKARAAIASTLAAEIYGLVSGTGYRDEVHPPRASVLSRERRRRPHQGAVLHLAI